MFNANNIGMRLRLRRGVGRRPPTQKLGMLRADAKNFGRESDLKKRPGGLGRESELFYIYDLHRGTKFPVIGDIDSWWYGPVEKSVCERTKSHLFKKIHGRSPTGEELDLLHDSA